MLWWRAIPRRFSFLDSRRCADDMAAVGLGASFLCGTLDRGRGGRHRDVRRHHRDLQAAQPAHCVNLKLGQWGCYRGLAGRDELTGRPRSRRLDGWFAKRRWRCDHRDSPGACTPAGATASGARAPEWRGTGTVARRLRHSWRYAGYAPIGGSASILWDYRWQSG